nr:carboxylate/amino acid/amine transporter [Neptunicella marina]
MIVITLLWAFSFSLIGEFLAGRVDAWFSVLMRIALALLVFLPFMRLRSTPKPLALKLMGIGAVQLGMMYGFYYQSFLHLSVPEVLLFTVMTPIYVSLLNDAFDLKFHAKYLLAAVIATLGAVAIRFNGISSDFLLGLLMVQCANLCFAFGQVAYKRLMQHQSLPQQQVFGWFFVGALLVAITTWLLWGNPAKLPQTSTQWGILIYLGLIASGLGYFGWNKGATLVNVGALAVMNNLLIPAGIVVNLLIWNRDADVLRLSIGAALILMALLLNQYLDKSRKPATD